MVKAYSVCPVKNSQPEGLSDIGNHPNADLNDLHLGDKMLELLKSGRLNNRFMCELVTHKDLQRFVVDVEIYID